LQNEKASEALRPDRATRAYPLLALTIDRLEFGIADPIGDRPEGGSGFNRLKLLRIADQNQFCPSLRHHFDEQRHLLGRDHASLIEHEVVLSSSWLRPWFQRSSHDDSAREAMPASFCKPSAALPANAPLTTR
jgi:hypothetical protein